MAWAYSSLTEALQTLPQLNIAIHNTDESLIIKMRDYGDLQLHLLLTTRQIIVETYICPLSTIPRQAELNHFLLRHQKILPLTSVGISQVQNEDYYIAFGALSLNSTLEDIALEIATLAENALDIAEVMDDYIHQ